MGRLLVLTALIFTLIGAFLLQSSLSALPPGREAQAAECGMPLQAGGQMPAVPAPSSVRTDIPELRVLTYNLHSGLGGSWRLFAPRSDVERNLRAIARHIVQAAPATSPVDAVGLNEVDFGSRRSGWLDQASFLADELKRLTGYTYAVVRGETWRRALPGVEVRFGNAALLRHPVLAAQRCILGRACKGSGPTAVPYRLFGDEPRGVLNVRMDFYGRPLNLQVTHLEAFARDRRAAQAAEVLQRFVRTGETRLLIGDMNAVVTTKGRHPRTDITHDILTSGDLLDARVIAAARDRLADLTPWATYPATAPRAALDGAFATADLLPLQVSVIGADESDHRGLLVRYGWLTAPATAAVGHWHASVRRQQLAQLVNCQGPLVAARYASWVGSSVSVGFHNASSPKDEDAETKKTPL